MKALFGQKEPFGTASADSMDACSPRLHPAPVCTIAAVFCLLVVLSAASLMMGRGDMAPRLLVSLWHVDEDAWFVLNELRLPRLYTGLIVGLALGIAGYLIQMVTKNPLADPDLMGITPAATLMVATTLMMGGSLVGIQVWMSVIGALAACGLIMLISRLEGIRHHSSSSMEEGRCVNVGRDPLRLILAGAALKGALAALTGIILLLDQSAADDMRFWVTGSIAGSNFQHITAVLVPLSVGLLLVASVARAFPALMLGESTACSLGYRPALVRATALVAIALLGGVSVALAGPITFLGMLVPCVARRLVGASPRYVLPLCALLGPVFLLFADICVRMIAPPAEQPLNLVMALLGAPFLIVMVRRRGAGSPGRRTAS